MAQTSPTVSTRPQPLKAFFPISSVTKDTSYINWKSESNSPTLLIPFIGWKSQYTESGLRSPGASTNQGCTKSSSYTESLMLKRTASFDTIYLQPSFNHKNHFVYGNATTTLCIDKSTQTFDGGSRWKNENDTDDILFRQRFQRKDLSSSSSVSACSATEHITTQTSPLTPVHRIETIRNSVEGLNQEIERLVLYNNSLLNVEREEDKDISEGHRAPLAELLGLIRSVNTQTPGENFTPSSMSSSGPPSRGDPDSPVGICPLVFCEDSLRVGDSLSKSEATQIMNKFISREPPDGCEDIKLKFVEEKRKPICDLSLLEDYPPIKPSLTFTLRPSTGSAFYSLSAESTVVPQVDEQGPSQTQNEK